MPTMRNRSAVPDASTILLLALSLIVLAAAVLAVSSKTPSVYSPYPLIQALLLWDGWPLWMVVGLAPLSYLALNVNLVFSQREGLRPRYLIMLSLLTLLSILYFGLAWRGGIAYQGWIHTSLMVALNLVFSAAGWILWAKSRSSAHRTTQLLAGTLLHCWLFWAAFPFLGEI